MRNALKIFVASIAIAAGHDILLGCLEVVQAACHLST